MPARRLPRLECPIALSAHRDEPLLETLAREIFALFPRCVRCGELVARFEDADIRVFGNRVTHRGQCPGAPGLRPAGGP